MTIIIPAETTINNNDILQYFEEVYNLGNFNNYSSLDNFSTFNNDGYFYNDFFGYVGNYDSFNNNNILDNYGYFYNGSSLENKGDLNNYDTLDNSSYLYNGNNGYIYNDQDNYIYNNDSIDNYGTLENRGSLYNFNSLYNYGFINNQGVLQNNGEIYLNSNKFVNAGLLSGSGIYVGNIYSSDGIIAPGGYDTSDTDDSLTIQGDYYQNGLATIKLSLSTPSSYDILNITGFANLIAGKINLIGLPFFLNNSEFEFGLNKFALINGDSNKDGNGSLSIDSSVLDPLIAFVDNYDSAELDLSIILENNALKLVVNKPNGVVTDDYNALVALYNSTNGDNWTDNTNWLTDVDVSQWYGVTVEGNRVVSINLNNNNLVGNFPTELTNLSNLESLWLSENQLTGEIPPLLGNNLTLQDLQLQNNLLTGDIPDNILNRTWEVLNLENPPYVVEKIPTQNILSGSEFIFDVSSYFGDLNGDVISYTSNDLPDGLTLDLNIGVISGIFDSTGKFEVTVTVTDDDGSVNGTLTFNVLGNDNFITGTEGDDNLSGTNLDDLIQGLAGKDKLQGNEGDDTIEGGDGNDQLYGNAGADLLEGGAGNDLYVVDADDIVNDSSGTRDGVYGAINLDLTNYTGIENLTLLGGANLSGTGDDKNNVINGNNGNNLLIGNDGKDTIKGKNGNDTLIGGQGNDVLAGGGGVDFFQFNTPNEGTDRITDFNVLQDIIVINGANFSPDLVAGSIITPKQFRLGASANTFDHRFVYNSNQGTLGFDPDGIGGSPLVFIAKLSNTPANFSETNIFII